MKGLMILFFSIALLIFSGCSTQFSQLSSNSRPVPNNRKSIRVIVYPIPNCSYNYYHYPYRYQPPQPKGWYLYYRWHPQPNYQRRYWKRVN